MIKHALTGILMSALLAGCQTEPEPCTPEWVQWKTEKVLVNFGIANRSSVNRLREFASSLENDAGPMLLLQVPGMIEEFETLAVDFQNDAWPALQAAAGQCNSTQELIPAFVSYLEQEGVGESVLEWAELLAALLTET